MQIYQTFSRFNLDASLKIRYICDATLIDVYVAKITLTSFI